MKNIGDINTIADLKEAQEIAVVDITMMTDMQRRDFAKRQAILDFSFLLKNGFESVLPASYDERNALLRHTPEYLQELSGMLMADIVPKTQIKLIGKIMRDELDDAKKLADILGKVVQTTKNGGIQIYVDNRGGTQKAQSDLDLGGLR